MRRLLLIAGLLTFLSGCETNSVGSAAFQTLQTAIRGADQPTGADLDTRFQYIRVTVGKTVAFLALGYVDPHPLGPIEVWYSADREVIRLQNGRVVGALGTLTEWRQVRLPAELPAWREMSARAEPFVWVRIRDVMPGYRFNTSDTLQLRVIAAPGLHGYLGRTPGSLIWFEERLLSTSADPVDIPRPAIFAVERAADYRVVYSEQCISADLCLTWQRWVPGQ